MQPTILLGQRKNIYNRPPLVHINLVRVIRLLTDGLLGFHKLVRVLGPEFDLSRLIMKVPATWEGLQACSRLKIDGIKTLATTLFTMEQVVLAGEAGCISISPFAHELRAHLDTSCVGSPGSKVPR